MAARCLDGAAADPLSARAVSSYRDLEQIAAREDRRSTGGTRSLFMAALLVIVLATTGLAVWTVTYRSQWSAADFETPEIGLVDTCARTFVLVLLSLLGLLALGVMYGNVLGSANVSP